MLHCQLHFPGNTKHPGLHTSEAIAAGMQKCKDTWIPQADTPMAVTDNAANEKKAFEQTLNWPQFGCYEDRINLVVKKGTSIQEIAKLTGKGRKLVTFFLHQ